MGLPKSFYDPDGVAVVALILNPTGRQADLSTAPRVLAGTAIPTSSSYPAGSIYIRKGTGAVYIYDGTSWSQITTSSGDYKASVRVATTANITLSGEQTIDGVSVVAGDRVLVKDQSTGSQNGIYVASASAWSRAADCDVASEITSGMLVPVEAGTIGADIIFQLTTENPITVGTTALTFSAAGGAIALLRDGSRAMTGQLQTAGRKLSVNLITSPATLQAGKDLNHVDCVSGAITVTMPAAGGDGAEVQIKRVDTGGSNTLTIQRAGSDTVENDAGSDVTSFTLANRGSRRFVSVTAGKWIQLS
jgi:phage-related tail fiber protein